MAPFDSLNTCVLIRIPQQLTVSCIISEVKLDVGLQSRFFIHPAFDAPGLGGPSEYCHGLCLVYRPTENADISDGEKV